MLPLGLIASRLHAATKELMTSKDAVTVRMYGRMDPSVRKRSAARPA
jgi:hypothetical protein